MTTSLATALGLAILASLAAAKFPPYRRAAGWFALAAIGQGLALSLVQAGPFPRYQHYPPVRLLMTTHPWLLAAIVLQTIIVASALPGAIAAFRAEADGRVAGWRIAIAITLAGITAATVSPSPIRFAGELVFAAYLQILAIATIALMVLAVPPAAVRQLELAIDRLLGREDMTTTEKPGRNTFGWIAAGVATLLAATLTVAAYDRNPHIPDEVVYLHHAKYLAEGLLTMPAPSVPAAFEVDLMENEATRWYSPVPPGWPAVLALGAWAGVPWLVNPLLAGINVLLAFVLIAHLYSTRVARAAAILLALSPWFLFLGMSFMTHQFTLTCALVAAVGVVKARQSGGWLWGLLAGVGVGATSLVRPLDGVIVGALIGAWAIGIGGKRLRIAPLAGLMIGTIAMGALVLPYNKMLTGDPLKFPINAYTDKHYAPNSNAYGFGPDRGLGWPTDPNPGHGPVDATINANLNTFAINTDLLGWGTGSLLLVAWLVCSGAWRRQDSVMMAVFIGFNIAYFFNYFSGGPDFGARYWFPAIVPLVALTVRGIQTLETRAGARVWLAVAALSLMTVVTYIPWRAADKYHNYRGMRADLRGLAAEHQFGADLVLVRGKRFPDYAMAFSENPVNLESQVAIYAWNRDDETRAAVLRAYADRRVWLIDGPSVTGAGYRIAAGPVEARTLLADVK